MVLKYLVLQNLRNVAALQEETEKPITNCYTRVIEAFWYEINNCSMLQ